LDSAELGAMTNPTSTIRRVLAVAMLMSAIGATKVRAQSITDANRVEFNPSADHSTLDANGNAIVTGYTMTIFTAGGTTPVRTLNLGKPSPGTDGFIRLDFSTLLSSPLAAGVSYEALVEAVGPGGSSGGTRTNTFGYTPTCTAPTLSATSQSFTATGGSGSVSVTAVTGCSWTASSPQTWVTITSGATGSGPGTVRFTVAANTSTTARSATLTIAGTAFTVSQSGTSCSYAVAPLSLTPAGTSLTGTISVTTSAGCTWNATSPVTWITVSGSGNGNGTVSFNLQANSTGSARSTTLTVAGKSVSVSQATLTKPPIVTNVRIVK
jgi:hypothetical protein